MKRTDCESFEAIFILIGFYSLIGVCVFLVFDNLPNKKTEIKCKAYRELSNVNMAFKKE